MGELSIVERHALRVAANCDVIGAWSNRTLTRLAMRKLLTEHPLRQPNGNLSSSKRWTITDLGRRAIEEAR